MRKTGVLAAAAFAVYGQIALAEVVQAPSSQSPAQKPSDTRGIPPCPTAAEQTAALGAKSDTGTEAAAAQPAERSGILPSAGGPGVGTSSAAPTVAKDGVAVRSPLDCPLVPGHPNSLAPGAQKLPEPSKAP